MKDLIILEYHKEQGFHYNFIMGNGTPKSVPFSYGWEPIAVTYLDKASVFCDIMNSKLCRRIESEQPRYTAEYVRKEWKFFCYAYNCIVGELDISQKEKELVRENFNKSVALARLGHGNFSDIKEDRGLLWAWEYTQLDLIDSNF